MRIEVINFFSSTSVASRTQVLRRNRLQQGGGNRFLLEVHLQNFSRICNGSSQHPPKNARMILYPKLYQTATGSYHLRDHPKHTHRTWPYGVFLSSTHSSLQTQTIHHHHHHHHHQQQQHDDGHLFRELLSEPTKLSHKITKSCGLPRLHRNSPPLLQGRQARGAQGRRIADGRLVTTTQGL